MSQGRAESAGEQDDASTLEDDGERSEDGAAGRGEEEDGGGEGASSPEGPGEDRESVGDDVAASCSARRCRPLEDEPPSKMARVDDDGETCSICLDSWSNSGPHRLVCLKCGHLFGYDCVARWLKSLPVKQRVCPTCKARAALRDIRLVFARRLVAVDTSELDELRAQLEAARAERGRAERDLASCRLSVDSTRAELARLRALAQDARPEPARAPERQWRLSLECTLDVAADGSCRALAYNCRKYELYATQRSALSLFPGYGLRKIDCVNQKTGKFIYLHPKVIRDVHYSALHDLTLSASLDKTARLTCGRTEQAVATLRTERPLWAGCWGAGGQVVVGGEGGACLVYDMRSAERPLASLAAGDRSPVVAAVSTAYGYLVAHLNSVRLYTPNGPAFDSTTLPIEGPFLALRYDEPSQQLLISCRPSAAHPFTRHERGALAGGGWAARHTHAGSRAQALLARPGLLRLRDELCVAAHSESDAVVELYAGAPTYRLMQRLSAQEPVLDMQGAELSGEPFLAALGASKLRLYRAACL